LFTTFLLNSNILKNYPKRKGLGCLSGDVRCSVRAFESGRSFQKRNHKLGGHQPHSHSH